MKNWNWLKSDHATVCLLDYPYFNEHCKLIAIDISKQQVLDADPKVVWQINFAWNLLPAEGIFVPIFHRWRSERNHLRFFTNNCEVIAVLFGFNIISVQNNSIWEFKGKINSPLN